MNLYSADSMITIRELPLPVMAWHPKRNRALMDVDLKAFEIKSVQAESQKGFIQVSDDLSIRAY